MLASIQHPLGVGRVWDENINRSMSAVTTSQEKCCAIAHRELFRFTAELVLDTHGTSLLYNDRRFGCGSKLVCAG